MFVDLVIALTLAVVWMWHEAKTTDRNAWRWCEAFGMSGMLPTVGWKKLTPNLVVAGASARTLSGRQRN